MMEGNTHVDSNDKEICEMHTGGETHMKKRVFYILQEVPYADFYNFNYEPIDKFRESRETQCIDGDTSSSSCDKLGDDRIGEAIHERCSCANHQQRSNVEDGQNNQCVKYYQGGENPNIDYPPGGEPGKNELSEEYTVENKWGRKESHRKKSQKIKRKNEFLKQCEFNSDGSCYYTISNSNHLKLFATDLSLLNELSNGSSNGGEQNINLRALHDKYEQMDNEEKEKRNESWICLQMDEHIYDCKFYPFFDWNNSNTCFFAVCSKGKPVCLHSAYDGSVIMSFKTVDECYELCNSYSLCFHPERNWILCGTNAKSIKVFDFEKPNEVYENRILSTRKGKGQKGIISTMAYKRKGYGENVVYAVGDYNDCIYLYADNCDHKNDFILKFQNKKKNSNGITCIKWLDEFSLLSGSRNGSFIYRYDMRKDTEYVQKWKRFALTNQKYLFDVYQDVLLISGDSFGYLNLYHLREQNVIYKEQINKYSPIISVNLHPTYPLLLTGSGTRRFYENNNNKVDIMASILSPGVDTSDHNLLDDTSSSIPFPSMSRYVNSVCTIWCDFVY
ncbi:conserved Plasmodium protein, unknown function [Plasmodium knowlesi strain H]|uniref:WD repeat-containing protein 79 n=3 Tax=Plasmodium knowlesi TaxID=5850 RepID=A0A5K1U6J9_PLAKH|nr:WD repeat-containing protein 79, putative [Plasmodium knowlesi strain H]OTN65529.1 Uncharacterized protein PKNOH_S110084600 [Plasmodium knowlesi]CAA9989467.1 WD repeat-containing protein 79, putative [Plasmodium knowlesi strain H]SBO25119.1 conserved Plasmodium protein, unknown function [Plasmodium knowlesi strain H]SBO27805.1 conserved Plasmodium protein, unknown function [Plasmodium knowlesi strain H]VVS78941.1 WD repeat-containing protein 79, putative [Plasmodium knowlesi strain H]|eukprot:XP_002260193.1 hypothetical protein, conserved in Plasmodium species [Plasmodium knowlesi strain H]